MNTNDELKNETANGTKPVLGEVFNQKVRIKPRISTGKFQGRYTKENQEWLEKNEGSIINAFRDGLNYYKLDNGFICHIYECSDVP